MSVWTDWAAAQRAARGLTEKQALLLVIMAGAARPDGAVVQGVRFLAERYGESRRTTERRLAELERLGLLVTRRRGSEVAWRILNGGVVPERQEREDGQTDLFSEGPNNGLLTGQIAARDGGGSTVADGGLADGGSATPWDGGSDPPLHGVAGEVNGNSVVVEAGARDERPNVLSPAHETVVSIVTGLPGVTVDPLAVEHALLAHPESDGYRHVPAAHQVASWAHQGELRKKTVAANSLLRTALRQQLEPQRPPSRTTPPRTGARQHGSVVARGDELLANLIGGNR